MSDINLTPTNYRFEFLKWVSEQNRRKAVSEPRFILDMNSATQQRTFDEPLNITYLCDLY